MSLKRFVYHLCWRLEGVICIIYMILCSTVWSELWRWIKCSSWTRINVIQMHALWWGHLVAEHFFGFGFITFYLWKKVTNVRAASKGWLHEVDLCTAICRNVGMESILPTFFILMFHNFNNKILRIWLS